MPLRSFTQAELILTERKRLERPLLLMIWLGIVGFSIAESAGGQRASSIFYALAATLAIVVNYLATQRAMEVHVGRVFVTIGVLASTLVLLLELLVGDHLLIVALSHYLILLQLCKLFERKANRDYLQMIALSVLLMVASSLLCDELWFAVVLLAYLGVACYTTMVFTLKRGLDAAADARLACEPGPLSPHRVAWNVSRLWPGGALMQKLCALLAAMLAAGAAVFLLAPRSPPAERTMSHRDSAAASASFNSDIRLGEAGKVYLSKHIAMRVRVSPGPGGRRPGMLYLRGQAMSYYLNSRWSKRDEEMPSRADLAPLPSDALGGTVTQEVTMESSLLPVLFGLYPAVRIEPAGIARITAGRQILYALPYSKGWQISYKVYSWPQPLTAAQREFLAAVQSETEGQPSEPASTVHVPQRVTDLARQWCRDLLEQRDGNPQRRDELDRLIAQRIAERLQAACTYSLDLSEARLDRDGVEDFLFYMKRGHCEYFASAETVMCRVLGVRARLVAGFRADEHSRESPDVFVVRNRDAHAWTEVYTPSGGWMIVDPTPASPVGGEGSFWTGLGDFWESVQVLWRERVIGYDADSRGQVVKALKDWGRSLLAALGAAWDELGESVNNLLVRGYVDAVLARLAIAIGALGIGLEALFVIRAIRRSRQERRQTMEKFGVQPEQLEFYSKLLRLLGRRGFQLHPGLTPRELVQQAAAGLNLPSQALAELIHLYYSLRWGRVKVSPEQINQANERILELDRMLQAPR